jgi:ureidoacrylate peracid hydrolase
VEPTQAAGQEPTARARTPLNPPLGVTEWPVEPARLLHPSHTALIVLDMMNRFLPPDSRSRKSGIVECVQRLLADARRADMLRVFVRVLAVDARVEMTGGYQQKLAAIGATPEARAARPPLTAWDEEVVAELAPQPGDVIIEKTRFSAFFSTWLDHLLRNHGIRTVVLTGVASYGAVIATAFDAAWRDYYVVVPPGGIAGEDPELHAATLALLSKWSLLDEETIRAAWR